MLLKDLVNFSNKQNQLERLVAAGHVRNVIQSSLATLSNDAAILVGSHVLVAVNVVGSGQVISLVRVYVLVCINVTIVVHSVG